MCTVQHKPIKRIILVGLCQHSHLTHSQKQVLVSCCAYVLLCVLGMLFLSYCACPVAYLARKLTPTNSGATEPPCGRSAMLKVLVFAMLSTEPVAGPRVIRESKETIQNRRVVGAILPL